MGGNSEQLWWLRWLEGWTGGGLARGLRVFHIIQLAYASRQENYTLLHTGLARRVCIIYICEEESCYWSNTSTWAFSDTRLSLSSYIFMFQPVKIYRYITRIFEFQLGRWKQETERAGYCSERWRAIGKLYCQIDLQTYMGQIFGIYLLL